MTQTQQPIRRYRYDPLANRYRDRARGVFVKPETVRRAVETLVQHETEEARALSLKLIGGEIPLLTWHTQMTTLIKGVHVAIGLAACGGSQNITARQLGLLAAHIKGQYQYLRQFAEQIARGQQPLNAGLVARAALYTQAARINYETMHQEIARASGRFTEERNVLGAAEHCTGCLAATAAGWVPLGTLTPIGERDCLQNCHCSLTYRS